MTAPTTAITPAPPVCIEWAPFIVNDGVDQSAILQAAQDVHVNLLRRQKGFMKRELFRGADGQWVDLVYWASEDDALRAVGDAAQSASCLAYFALMRGIDHDDLGKGIAHFRRMAKWDPTTGAA